MSETFTLTEGDTTLTFTHEDGSTFIVVEGSTSEGSAGVTDHGALTGLADDDHSHYLNNARGDARYWPLSTDLATQAELNTHAANATAHGDFLLKSGGTMTGALVLASDPSSDLHPVSRQYLEAYGFRYRLRSGSYYQAFAATNQNAAVVNLRAYAAPFVVTKSRTFDRICIAVQTAAGGSTVRLMIYADDGNGFPGALLLDAGTVDTSSTGLKEITINQTLHGAYWLAAKASGTPTLRCLSGYGLFVEQDINTTGAATQNNGYSKTTAAATADATFPSDATPETATVKVGLRAA